MVKSASPDVKQELGATSATSDELDLEGKELLTYFSNLSDKDRKGILHNLRDHNEGNNFARRPLKVMSQPHAHNIDDERATLYNAIDDHRNTVAATATKKAASQELQSGLLISPAPCTNKDLGAVNIILCKQDRGYDAIARKKVVKALEPKIAAGNISCMLTSNDAADYDVAADALSWQTTLKGISRFCQQYDMMSLLKIPQDVDFSWP
jgi:hypothetical protein